VITIPNGDILEDRVVTATGTYAATAFTRGGGYVMQLVAFRAGIIVPDVQPPDTPAGLTVVTQSSSQVALSWTPATDNVAVTVYLVERCQDVDCTTFQQIGTTGTTSFIDSGLRADTSYSYRVRASDEAGNLGGYSNIVSTRTAELDSQPPSAPGALTAIAISGTQVNLSWGAATDNVGVTGYRLERCEGAGCTVFIKLTTPTGTTFSDVGLTPDTSYTYIVLATDAAGNLGPYSNPAIVRTGHTVPELVVAFSFNEGTGTVATDISGAGNHGQLTGAAWTLSGKFDGAISFNGAARVIVSDNPSLHLTSGLTLEAWVRPSNVSSGWRDVIYKGNDIYYLEATTLNGGVPAAGVTLSQSGNSNTYGPSVLPADTWSHLAQTYDGTTVRLYVNGVQVASDIRPGSLVTSAYPLEIGGDSIFGQYFEGLIDEVRVYNVARTPAQIQSDMNTPVGSSVPIVSLSSNAIDFGQQATGVTSGEQDVTLTNIGGAALSIAAMTVTGANGQEFTQTSTCGNSVPAGGSCTIAVRFVPDTVGAKTAAVTIQDNAAGAPHTIGLHGSGVAVAVTPAVTTLTPGRPQQFTAVSASTTTFIWAVDGITGGGPDVGTITTDGLYTAASGTGTHTITATTPDLLYSGSAAVFVVSYSGTFTFHNDNARTGANLNETVLTPSTVNSVRFGKLQSYALDGAAYASPLYVPAVTVPGQGVHNVVYVATEHNSVYAFDADGTSATPLWKVSFIDPVAGITTVLPTDTGECCDIVPEIGITGTPVIDPTTGTLYVVAKTKETVGGTTTFVQRLHALDTSTGAEKFGGPVVITGSVPGTGAGSSGGQIQFLPLRQNQRPALLLNNGVVYIAFGSHGDQQPYHGWIMGYDAATLQQTMIYNATPNGEGAGIWLANAGIAADTSGAMYFATGDGSFNADTGGVNFGDSYVKLDAAGRVLDYFTPHNEGFLDGSNADLGSGGIMLLPDQPGAHPRLLVSAGKNGTIDLIDRENMGHFNPVNDNQIVQSLVDIFPFGTPEPGNYSAPVYFNGTIYFSPVADSIQAFRLNNGLFNPTPTSRSARIFQYPGGTLALSASGTTNGILWALERRSSSNGALRAYDANDLGIELYNSDQAGTRDVLDEVVKFSAPLIANGKVYVGSATRLTIFGPIQ
jgi:chitodextrinase